MDLNLTVLCGRLAADPELRVFDSGTRLIRFLIAINADHPRRRLDVIPVTLWDPPDDLVNELGEKGSRIWACGSVQRRFWESPGGETSRIEVVVEQVNFRETDEFEPVKAD